MQSTSSHHEFLVIETGFPLSHKVIDPDEGTWPDSCYKLVVSDDLVTDNARKGIVRCLWMSFDVDQSGHSTGRINLPAQV